MNIKKIKTLSFDQNFPYGNSVEYFLKKYHIDHDVEIYRFFYDVGMEFTQYEHLKNINYRSKIIFWITNDSFEDEGNIINNQDRKELKKIETICNDNPDKIFILCNWQYNLNQFITARNLFTINPINVKFNNRYIRCNKKIFKDKRWILLNNKMLPHRLCLISYLVSHGLDKNGLITNGNNYAFLEFSQQSTFIEKYLKKVLDFFNFGNNSEKVKTAYNKVLNDDYDKLFLHLYESDKSNSYNYRYLMKNVYQHTALEIISSSSFFDAFILGEKEIQNIYAQNFPIYISSPYTADIMKNKFGFDIFDDIIDHSYDKIIDPGKRLLTAIDSNIHLLNNTVDLEALWYKNQHRFEKNCNIADKLFFDRSHQVKFDEAEIKKAFDHFNIKYTKKKKTKSI